MKKIFNWFAFLFVFFCMLIITFSYIKVVIATKNLKNKNILLNDSIGELNFEINYLSDLLWQNSNLENSIIHNNVYVYEMSDKNKVYPISLKLKLLSGKPKLIVRYTEIGCNSCTDSTFKLIRENKSILKKYEVLVLVDFSSYDNYLKWKKISEIEEKVLWLKKGSLPFLVEKADLSYLFVIGSDQKFSSIFIPNSHFTYHLRNYLNRII